MKQFLFTGGLPRSGSTLLTALLNQNPHILATNGTDLNKVFDNLDVFLPTLRGIETKEYLFEYNNLLRNLYQVFFSNAVEPIIIDKIDRNSSPQSLIELLRLTNPEFKVVLTVRPILEILASFTAQCNKSPDNVFDLLMKQTNYEPLQYRSLNEARCDYLMREDSPIQKTIYFLDFIRKSEHKDHFLIITYDELSTQTQETMNKIYNFYELPLFKQDLNNIKNDDQRENDSHIYGIPELHLVKSTIVKSPTTPKELLSDYTIKKYENFLDFLSLF